MSEQLRIGSLCSGYPDGGLEMATLEVLGGTVAWHADNDPAAIRVLAHRWPGVPNHGDITAVWSTVEPVDVITAGYPCQPDSDAGKRRGTDDARWIWPAVRDTIRDLGPRLVVLENVRGHLGRGFPTVVGDLADIGYDARWCCIPASAVGAPHRRERLFAVAHPTRDGRHKWWSEPARILGRPDDAVRVPTPEALLSGMREYQDDRGHGHPALAGEATSQGCVRDVRGDSSPPCPSHRPGSSEQRPGEPTDALFVLPPETALAGGPRQEDGGCPEISGNCGCALWGRYAPAVHRWEMVLGRQAPSPTELSPKGTRRLSARASEWIMGLPAGWVTAVPGLSRNDQLRLIGNGVVPLQAIAALRWLLNLDQRAGAA